EPREQRARRRLARFAVADRADDAVPVARGRRRLAEVVAEQREADRPVARVAGALAREMVEHVAGVHEDVALGVPLRILRAAVEGRDLGEEAQRAALLQETQPARRLDAVL